MNIINSALRSEELAIFDLRELYEQYGYKKYKMSRFEEYDLYLEYKSFLPSQQMITFTDLSGRLLALKPDVTLSIAKNVPLALKAPEKLFYNENVYRTAHGSNELREIVQLGLEYIGELDLYGQSEVLLLAYRSLQKLSDDFVLVVSDMGFVSGLLDSVDIPVSLKDKILSCIGHKNAHEIIRLCDEAGVEANKRDALAALAGLSGSFEDTLSQADNFVVNEKMQSSLTQLRDLYAVLSPEVEDSRFRLDFSVINDLSYYNGLIFQGFIDGVPSAVIFGGRYDNLMEKLGKQTNAMGFAVYIDQLSRLNSEEEQFDVDSLLLYDEGADAAKLASAVRMLTQNGQRVRTQKGRPDKLRYKQLLKFGEGGLSIVNEND